MSKPPDLWELRELHGGPALDLRAGHDPALVLTQGETLSGCHWTKSKPWWVLWWTRRRTLPGCWPAAKVTMPDLVPWLIALALAVLLGFLWWMERPRSTACTWCEVHRRGGLTSNGIIEVMAGIT